VAKKVNFGDNMAGVCVSELSQMQKNTCPTEIKTEKVTLLNTARRIGLFSEGNRAPNEKDTIIYLDGSFDLLH
jgi:hypothetical protein